MEQSGVPPIERRNRILYIVGSFVFVFVALIAVIIFVLSSRSSERQINTIQIEEQKAAAVPTQRLFKKSDITFEVMNGSRIPGAAGREAKVLSGAGYIIAKIGNSDSVYQATQLFLTPAVLIYKDELMADLQADFPKASYAGELTDSTASARLVIGKD